MAEPDPDAAWTAFQYVVVDVEGNGQRVPDLVEISVVPIQQGSIGKPKTWLVRPPRPITAMARSFHQITDDEVRDAPTVAEIADDLRGALDGMVFAAHNAWVDLGVLTRELPGFDPAHVLDTLKLARRLLPGRESYKLGALAHALGLVDGLPPDSAPHRATYDATICARLLLHLVSLAPSRPPSLTDLLNPTPCLPEAPATLF